MNYTIKHEECMWERIRETDAPLLLYGTGNGADKLIAALSRIGRKPDGVFASDGFVRSRTFYELPVLSYSEARKHFGDGMTVLVAFGSSLPSVMEQMRELSRRHTLFIPELPLYGTELFTYEYFLAKRDKLETVYGMLQDESSRALFCDMLDYRLRGELRFLSRTQSAEDSYREMFSALSVQRVLDGGAFCGDSAGEILRALPTVTEILACEPDTRTFRKLSSYAEEMGGITPVNCALSDTAGELTFHTSGSRGSGADGKNRRGKDTSVQAETIDRLCAESVPDLIKLDVEGFEAAALRGSTETLRHRPAWAISLYHRAEDLFALPLWLAEHAPDAYRYYLRRVPCYPAWDLCLYAVPARP